MIPYVSERDSITFNPTGLIIDGIEKKISDTALVKIDVHGVGQLLIRDNDVLYNYGSRRLSGIRYGDVVYNYDADAIRKIVDKYGEGSCAYCKRKVPITARNIIGLKHKEPRFVMFCPFCRKVSSYWIEERRVKPVVIIKPTAVVEVRTELGSVYDVFPGSFRSDDDKEVVFFGKMKTETPDTRYRSYYRYTLGKERIKEVTFHNGRKIALNSPKAKPKTTKKKINPNDIVTVYTTGNTCYRLVSAISFKGRNLYFNGARRDAIDGRVIKVNLHLASIQSIVVGKVLYDINSVELEETR